MALESVALFLLTAFFLSLPALIMGIGMKVFFRLMTLFLIFAALGSLLVYGIAWLEEQGKREMMLIVALIFVPLFIATLHFTVFALSRED